MPEQITDADLELLGELGVDLAPSPAEARTAREQRIIAGFEEIARFVEAQGRLPQHGEGRDIFERLYAVRLERLRASDECRAILAPLDTRRLLAAAAGADLGAAAALSDDALLDALGVADAAPNAITRLVHVRSRAEIKAAEEVAQRTPCADFARFRSLFEDVQRELASGARVTVKYQDNAAIEAGELFILDGQKLLVAAMGELFVGDHGRPDRRLRVVYDNATESDLLMRSLQRALNKDKASRRIKETDLGPLFAAAAEPAAPPSDSREPDLGPLFAESAEPDELPSGVIYVLRSNADHPFIKENRAVIHKIGVTGGDVQSRIANARHAATYLLADVEVVATYTLVQINRKKLEALLQQFFSAARLDLALADRFGIPVQPREWFLVPLDAIAAALEHISAGTLDQYRYDVTAARLVRIEQQP